MCQLELYKNEESIGAIWSDSRIGVDTLGANMFVLELEVVDTVSVRAFSPAPASCGAMRGDILLNSFSGFKMD